MRRLLNNLLTFAVIGLVSTSASLVMAHGGGGHGGGHSSGHSTGHSSAGRSVTRSSGHGGSHAPLARTVHPKLDVHPGSHLPNKFVRIIGNNPPGTIPNNPPVLMPVRFPPHRWHYHMHYPVGFWFGGHIDDVAYDVADGGIDVAFTKIEQLDAGDPSKNLAPAYRVWFQNNSDVDINQPFDVALLASTDQSLSQGLPYASVRIDGLAADQTTSVDIRLPISAMTMAASDGQSAPYSYVHTIIDAQKELVETDKANNLSIDARDTIPAVTE